MSKKTMTGKKCIRCNGGGGPDGHYRSRPLLWSLQLFLRVSFVGAVFTNTSEIFFNNTNGTDSNTTTVKLLVQYNNQEGRQATIEVAEGESLESESTRFQAGSIEVNETEVEEVVGKLNNNPHIKYVEIDYQMTTLPVVVEEADDDSFLQKTKEKLGEGHGRRLQLPANEIPYGVEMVQAPAVWNLPSTPANDRVKVCVVDTGYGLGHPDLPNNGTHGVEGWSPPRTSYGVWHVDGNSHGTHCAGTIGALSNQEGVVGVLPESQYFQFVIAKGLSDGGFGSSSTVIAAVEACVEAGAKVISMSLGGGGYSTISNNVYRDVYNEGVLIVAAAGNDGTAGFSYPASYPHVMSVAAVDADGVRPNFSQFNNQVEIAAPGVRVWSTVTSDFGASFGFAPSTGTSMATPHVAGVAALVWFHFPNCTNHQIRNVLLRTASFQNVDSSSSCNVEYGHGIVNAQAAYELLEEEGCEGAGGANPSPLASANVGGCGQDPNYVPPPPADCSVEGSGANTFRVEITTDNYPQETTWELRDVNGDLVETGGPYRQVGANFTKTLCLSPSLERFQFTIFDSFGDGLCCRYGLGSYRLYYDDIPIWAGASFERSEVTIFPDVLSPTVTPSASPTDHPTTRPTSVPTNVPSTVPTSLPTQLPTASPSSLPTSIPTAAPQSTAAVITASPVVTTVATSLPTAMPSADPTSMPTSLPTAIPTSLPTAVPTSVPTSTPTSVPTTALPSTTPTKVPTTPPPSTSPENAPTFAPVTDKPSLMPTTLPPTAGPTGAPQHSPTLSPSTSSPSQNPTDKPIVSSAAPATPLIDASSDAPTRLPTTPVQVVAPPPCEVPNKLFYLRLRTDAAPQETTWELLMGEQQLVQENNHDTSVLVASGGPYNQPSTVHERYLCLSPPPPSSSSSDSLFPSAITSGRSVYSFFIYDWNGLRKGRPKGRYEVFLEGKRILRGKRFVRGETIDFFPAQCFDHEEGFCNKKNRRLLCCTKKCKRGTCWRHKKQRQRPNFLG